MDVRQRDSADAHFELRGHFAAATQVLHAAHFVSRAGDSDAHLLPPIGPCGDHGLRPRTRVGDELRAGCDAEQDEPGCASRGHQSISSRYPAQSVKAVSAPTRLGSANEPVLSRRAWTNGTPPHILRSAPSTISKAGTVPREVASPFACPVTATRADAPTMAAPASAQTPVRSARG